MTISLNGRHYLRELDFTAAEIHHLLDLATELKAAKRAGTETPRLDGRRIALIFEKASTRTRCAFEVAAADQGATTTYLGPDGSHIGHKESIADTARVLGRMYDGIEYRGFDQQIVTDLAQHAGVPVFNGLTDQCHPTQSLCDVFTMREHSGKPVEEISFCYLGDARNNTANSLLMMGSLLGMDVRIAAPRELWPAPALVDECRRLAQDSGARITLSEEVEEAVRGADYLYTDVWVSMGENHAQWAERIAQLLPYQVNAKTLAATGNPDTAFLHCLPALHDRRTDLGAELAEEHGLDGLEVTDEVFESPASLVFDQAENRMHTIKAVLVATLGRD
ncbi:ornithine carbamoyltransferase [Kitasatospora sp. NPDC059673]|uniref:ornithine carbamoyltransferase n=1 Tax=Kitasatospora sp. NPDC059673 TaxID=3346901 RepID=UPI0036C99175